MAKLRIWSKEDEEDETQNLSKIEKGPIEETTQQTTTDLPDDTSPKAAIAKGTPPPEAVAQGPLDAESAFKADEDAPFANSCRPDAPIWGLYLKETEAEDKELTEIWNNSLDSLLIFSRKDLQEDPQQYLLKQILVTLQQSNADPALLESFQPDPTSIHVNGLWFSSLTLTLVSALGGVLAKGWLAKYNPASRRERAVDAYDRQLRALRAQQWKLAPIITTIPLLIQVSLFLFFAGLIIQILDNNIQIWLVVVVLVTVAVLLYIFSTVLPWFSPSSPFQTPISAIISSMTGWGQAREKATIRGRSNMASNSWVNRLYSFPSTVLQFIKDACYRPKELELLADALSWIVTSSTEEATIQEAIKTIGSAKHTGTLQRTLISSECREPLYQRLAEFFKSRLASPGTSEDGTRLEATLYTLLRLEQPLTITEAVIKESQFDFQLKEGQALHRWNDYPPYLQALAFSLRVHILIKSGRDDQTGKWNETKRDLIGMVENGMAPYVRRIVTFSALRGVLKGEENVRKLCVIVLSSLVEILGVANNIDILGEDESKCLRTPGASEKVIMMQEIVRLCGNSENEIRAAGIQILGALMKYSRRFNYGFGALLNLVEGGSCGAIRAAIPQMVELLKDENLQVRRAAASAVSELRKYAELRDAIRAIIPQLFKLLKDRNWEVRRAAVAAASELGIYAELRDAIRAAIPQLVKLLKDRKWEVQRAVVAAVSELGKYAELRDTIRAAIPQLVELLKDGDANVRAAGAAAISGLSKHGKWNENWNGTALIEHCSRAS
ncbi:hypothetical protein M408DRAFT_268950 [Serendipita vermifera MAFF 305830]|uniref:DUF6535 domain-containing protein n=1 Tax=Serendipita vermifera MAFF 305830 TaxID=933852 RepID=A0A0C2W8Z9_SERVB|nr:hypothetical protein M408DRAFT_268950 [Serendipita vermifera MAFF 305830]